MTAAADTDSIETLVSALSGVDLDRFPQCLAALAAEESAGEVIAKALRAFERLRRAMSRCMDQGSGTLDDALKSTLRAWLMRAVNAGETILETCPTVGFLRRRSLTQGDLTRSEIRNSIRGHWQCNGGQQGRSGFQHSIGRRGRFSGASAVHNVPRGRVHPCRRQVRLASMFSRSLS